MQGKLRNVAMVAVALLLAGAASLGLIDLDELAGGGSATTSSVSSGGAERDVSATTQPSAPAPREATRAAAPDPAPSPVTETAGVPLADASYVLALTWHPAFCETDRGDGRPECRDAGASQAGRFTLHGLWPQPRDREYCTRRAQTERAKGGWSRMAPLDLGGALRARLEDGMPGARSHLDRHQFYKHGSCYHDLGPREYFADMLELLDQANASSLRAFLEDREGRRVRSEELRAAADRAFGRGAGDRVEMVCDDEIDGGRRLMLEVRIALAGEITEETEMGALMAQAPTRRSGCREGFVDAAGLQ